MGKEYDFCMSHYRARYKSEEISPGIRDCAIALCESCVICILHLIYYLKTFWFAILIPSVDFHFFFDFG